LQHSFLGVQAGGPVCAGELGKATLPADRADISGLIIISDEPTFRAGQACSCAECTPFLSATVTLRAFDMTILKDVHMLIREPTESLIFVTVTCLATLIGC
jgi:hypothetical protein